MITRRYMVGQKSTAMNASPMIFRDGQWWFPPVWAEEQDRRKARATIPKGYAAFRRLVGAIRSS